MIPKDMNAIITVTSITRSPAQNIHTALLILVCAFGCAAGSCGGAGGCCAADGGGGAGGCGAVGGCGVVGGCGAAGSCGAAGGGLYDPAAIPQVTQKRASLGLSLPQFVQTILISPLLS